MTDPRLVPAVEIRSAFSAAMSAMYRDEIPVHGTLMTVIAKVNNETHVADPELKARPGATDMLDRISEERHSAIRLGTAEKLSMMRRAFVVMGMYPVGYYATTFRAHGTRSIPTPSARSGRRASCAIPSRVASCWDS